jgi:hypothetical protein
MRGGEMAEAVLQQVQMLDQKIAASRPFTKDFNNFSASRRVDLTAFGYVARPAAAGTIGAGAICLGI